MFVISLKVSGNKFHNEHPLQQNDFRPCDFTFGIMFLSLFPESEQIKQTSEEETDSNSDESTDNANSPAQTDTDVEDTDLPIRISNTFSLSQSEFERTDIDSGVQTNDIEQIMPFRKKSNQEQTVSEVSEESKCIQYM